MVFQARGCGRRGGNVELLEEIRKLQTRMEALEENQQRDPIGGDVSDNEEDPKEEREAEADCAEV